MRHKKVQKSGGQGFEYFLISCQNICIHPECVNIQTMEQPLEQNQQLKQEYVLSNGVKVFKEFYDLVQFRMSSENITEERVLEHFKDEVTYDYSFVYRNLAHADNAYEYMSAMWGRFYGMLGSKYPDAFEILAPAEVRPKIEKAIEKRKEMVRLITESLEDLSGWRELFAYEAHPYLNEAYASIFAFLKDQGIQVKGAKVLDVGFGSLLNAPQELAEQGAQSYAIDPDSHVPHGIQRRKVKKSELREMKYGNGFPQDFWLGYNEIETDGPWNKLPPTQEGGQVRFAHKSLVAADSEHLLEDNSFEAVYSDEVFEYGALYFPSEEDKWNEISKTNLDVIFRKLKEGGIFISRTMRGHIFTPEQLNEVGFEVVCFDLPLKAFNKPLVSNDLVDSLELSEAKLVVCRKPILKKVEKGGEI